MKKQLLIAGIICGIICAACVFLYTEMVYAEADSKRSEALERYGGEQVEVVVATRTIHPGETLDPSNCTTKTWLSDLLPDGALMELSEMEGKQATSLILEGEVVSQSRFNNETQELDIPAGYVAIALPAEDIQAVGGRISAGSKVDVYATGAKTACLGRDLEVLATSADNDESSSRTKLTWITLAVKPPLNRSRSISPFLQAKAKRPPRRKVRQLRTSKERTQRTRPNNRTPPKRPMPTNRTPRSN